MKRLRCAVSLVALFALGAWPARAHSTKPVVSDEVGVDEHLGAQLPMNLSFTDETGARFTLGEGIRKPALVLMLFYHCPVGCPIMLAELADCLKTMPLKAGRDYQALTVSLDDEDVPALAGMRKENYLPGLGPAFPADQWKFLVGDSASIAALTQALGYRYKKLDSHEFIHPNVMIAVSPQGKITRYIYGPDYQPFLVAMALTEAARGTPGMSVRRVLSYCFSFDPTGRRYVLNTTRIAGVSVLVGVGLFLVFLTRGRRKPAGSPS